MIKGTQSIIFILVFTLSVHAQCFEFGKLQRPVTIPTGIFILHHATGLESPVALDQGGNFKPVKQAIPNAGWANTGVWLKLDLCTPVGQALVLQINNPVFSNFKFYLYENTNLLKTLPWQAETRLPQISFYAAPHQKLTLYIFAKSILNPLKFPVQLIPSELYNTHESKSIWQCGLLVGVLGLLIVLNVLAAIFFKIRLFVIQAVLGILAILLYVYITGFWFQWFGIQAFVPTNFNINYTIYFGFMLLQLLLPWYLFRLVLNEILVWRAFYILLFILIFATGLFFVFGTKWLVGWSNTSVKYLSYYVRLLAVLCQIFTILASVKLLAKVEISKWYLVAIIPAMLSYLLPRFVENIFNDAGLVQSQLFLWACLWHIVVLGTGFVYLVSKNYVQKSMTTNLSSPKPPFLPKKTTIYWQVLSTREQEILKAFTNGYSYQEISDAFFISPHTVRTHLKNIYQKIGVSSKVEAVRWVIEADQFE